MCLGNEKGETSKLPEPDSNYSAITSALRSITADLVYEFHIIIGQSVMTKDYSTTAVVYLQGRSQLGN